MREGVEDRIADATSGLLSQVTCPDCRSLSVDLADGDRGLFSADDLEHLD